MTCCRYLQTSSLSFISLGQMRGLKLQQGTHHGKAHRSPEQLRYWRLLDLSTLSISLMLVFGEATHQYRNPSLVYNLIFAQSLSNHLHSTSSRPARTARRHHQIAQIDPSGPGISIDDEGLAVIARVQARMRRVERARGVRDEGALLIR